MILDRSELKLFHAAMSLVEIEGNKRLHIVPYSIKYEPPAPDDEAELLDAIFHSPDVLKDIAEHLPPQTPRKVAELIQSWQHPLAGKFTIVQLGPEPLFLGFGRAFAVAGISHSIASVVGGFPAAVDTVLLPFGRFIVYDAYLETYDMGFSERMKSSMLDEAKSCKEKGLIVRDGRELAKMAPQWIEEEEKSRKEDEAHRQELETRDEMPEGCHKGVLAGLTPEERERAVKAQDDAYFKKIDASSAEESVRKRLKQAAAKGKASHDAAEQLSQFPKRSLQTFAHLFDIKVTSKLRKAEIAEKVAQGLEEKPEFVEEILSGCRLREIESLRKVAEAGGTEEYDLKDPEGLRTASLMPQIAGLGMLFVSEDTATYCLSDLLMARLSSLDWDEIEDRARQAERISNRIGAAVYLRGIAPADEMLKEFGEGLPEAEVTDIVLRSMLDDPGYVIMSFEGDPDTLYMVTYALCDTCYPPDEEDGPAEGFKFEEEMDPLIKQILDGQRGKKPRPLPEGVERDGDLVEWMLSIPEVQELRSYLDAHVPDDADDYLFADDVVERYLDDMQAGMPGTKAIQYYLGILDDYGLVPTEAVLTQLLDRIMNMTNAVPTWPNNGWAPNELMEQDFGKKPNFRVDTAPID